MRKSGLTPKERSLILKIPSFLRFPQDAPLGNLTPELNNLTTLLFNILAQHKEFIEDKDDLTIASWAPSAVPGI